MVFDVGGVLLDWNPRYLYESLIPDASERERFLADICTMEWNATLDAGRSFDDACEELAGQHPDHAEWIHAWKRQDDMVSGLVPGTAGVLSELRRQGMPVYLLTNMPSDVFARRREQFAVLRECDGAVVSGDERMLKPSLEIFHLLAARFDLDPASTLFIDDVFHNVEAAHAAGFLAHQFLDAESLADELERYGLRLDRRDRRS